MKKFLTLLLAAVMLMTVALPMTSCSAAARLNRMDESDRAVKLFEMSNQKADTASSFNMEQTMVMKMDIAGSSYDQKGVANLTVIENKDSFIYLEQSELSVTAGGVLTLIYEDSGYADGYMFSRYKENADELKVKSPITKDEYFAFREEMADDSSIDVEVEDGLATVMTCVQNEDKTWKATYEGFTEEGMKPFMEMLDGIEYTVTADHPIVDVRLTWETNEDLFPTKTSIEFVFEKNPEADSKVPTLSIVSVYKGWNNTVLAQPYDISGFTEVEDLRHMERFISALKDRETDSAGHFTVKNETEVRVPGGQTQEIEVKQDVTFKNRDGMELTISYEQEGYLYTMSYRDGSLRTVVKEKKTGTKVADETVEMTNSEAQATLSQLVNSEQISGIDLADVQVLDAEAGKYRFNLSEAVGTGLAEVWDGTLGGKQTDFNGYVEATVKDGILTQYKYHVFCNIKVQKQAVYVNVDLTVTFLDVTEDSGSV